MVKGDLGQYLCSTILASGAGPSKAMTSDLRGLQIRTRFFRDLCTSLATVAGLLAATQHSTLGRGV